MKIAVLGSGMVGQVMAVDLAKVHDVTAFDISNENLSMIQKRAPNVNTSVVNLS